MIWYELESPNHSKASKSPRSSISETGKGGLRGQIRSVSGIHNYIMSMIILFTYPNIILQPREFAEERELDGFLHPDHAYMANSRRGSSQSEQLDVEPYQLNKDFSRSLPGSRRSSFQSIQNTEKGKFSFTLFFLSAYTPLISRRS